jgi:hypothetical protein
METPNGGIMELLIDNRIIAAADVIAVVRSEFDRHAGYLRTTRGSIPLNRKETRHARVWWRANKARLVTTHQPQERE